MVKIISKRTNVYKMLSDLKESLQSKIGIPQTFIMFTDIKNTENGSIKSDTFYMDISDKEILDILDSKNIKYKIDQDKKIRNYIFNLNDKDKVKDILNKYNLKKYDRTLPIQDIEVIDNSYLEKYLYQFNK